MLSGTDVGKALLGLSGLDREKKILSIVQAQGIVSYGGGGLFSKIVSSATIAKKAYTLELSVSPMPFCLGTEGDPFLTPAWPWTYQTLADSIGCLLPTRKICLLVAQQAQMRIDPHPFATQDASGKDDGGIYNESSDRYIQSNEQILDDISKIGYTTSMLVSGAKKDVVVGPGLDGNKVAIFGWFFKNGKQADSNSDRWQPYSTIHESTYADYSHGWRVVSRAGRLNGQNVNVDTLCQDATLWPLVSDQGPFAMRFPSLAAAGTSSGGKLATAAGLVGGVALGGTIGFVLGGPLGAAAGALIGGVFGRNA